MKVIHPGIQYQLEDGQNTKITFEHYDTRLGVKVSGTTVEELMTIILLKKAYESGQVAAPGCPSSLPSFPSVKKQVEL